METMTDNGNQDLFTQILQMEMTREDTIPEEDAAYCRSLKESLDRTLDSLKEWYDKLDKLTETMGHDYQINRYDDGRITGFERSVCFDSLEKQFAFDPFKPMTDLAEKYVSACTAFRNKLIRYFNDKYSISVSSYSRDSSDQHTIISGTHPTWEDTVQDVIAHLGGRSFRDTAEDEIINRLHNMVTGWRGQLRARLTGRTISLIDQLGYSDYTPCRMDYSYRQKLDQMTNAMLLGAERRIDGGIGSIRGLNTDYTIFGEWYETDSEVIDGVKFYKNGKIDFRFRDTQSASDCWAYLRLDQIKDED